MNDRMLQVNSLIQANLGMVMNKELDLPENCVATITKVSISRDLRTGRVGLGIWPDDKAKEVAAIIKKRWGALQYELNQTLRLRVCPKLTFYVDDTEKSAFEMEDFLDGIDMSADRNKNDLLRSV